jgi:hypothetical protein
VGDVYNILILFGADFIGVALGFGALRMGLRGFFTRMDRVNQTLVAGTVFILVAGAFGQYADPVTGAHDIIPVLPFCAVLAGLGYNDIQPKPVPPSSQLAVWLEAHHRPAIRIQCRASFPYCRVTKASSH